MIDPMPSSSKVTRFDFHLVWPLVLSSTEGALRALNTEGSKWKNSLQETPQSEAYAVHHFLLPHVREILRPQHQFRRTDLDTILVDIDGETTVGLAVTAVELKIFESRIATFSFSARAMDAFDLRTVQLFSHRLRRSYAGYWNVDPKARNVPSTVTFISRDGHRQDIPIDIPPFLNPLKGSTPRLKDEILPYWTYLLAPLKHDPDFELINPDVGFINPHNEQIPCLRFIGLTDSTLSDDEHVSVGLAEPLEQHPKKFRDRFFALNTYDRWWALPRFTTRFFITGQAFTILAAADDHFSEFLSTHLRRQYLQLHILALIIRSGLELHRESLFRAGKRLDTQNLESEIDNIDKLLEAYLYFVRGNLVQKVSGQEQGQEIFERICRANQLPQLEKETAEMASKLRSHSETFYTKRTSETTIRLAIVGGLGMALGLVFGFWGMNFFQFEREELGVSLILWFFASVCVSLAFAGIVAKYWRKINRRVLS